MAEIPFSGTYTRDELLRFDRAARDALGSSSLYSMAGCYGAAAIAVLVLAIIQWNRGNESGALQWFVLFAIGVVLAAAQWWSTRRSFGRHPNLNQTLSGVLRDENFEIRTPTSESTIAWSGIASVTCTRDYIILASPTQSLYGFSREFFQSPQDFVAACELVRSRVKNKPARSMLRRMFQPSGV